MTSLNTPGPASVFLVSGGARGITADCVVALAQRYQSTFILLGRSAVTPEPEWAIDCDDEAELKKRIVAHLQASGAKPLPRDVQAMYQTIIASREIEQTVQRVHAAGSAVDYIPVDVTDSAALLSATQAVVERFGPVTGIIHGAGVLADKLIEKKTEQDFERVYAAKVHGLENLLNCVPLDQLQHVILFSSVAGFSGNVGQTDYALANDILNKAAYLINDHAPNCRVIAVNWGPWDAGMVTPALKQYFAENQIAVIPVETGTQMLVEELEHGTADSVQIVVGSVFNVQSDLRSDHLQSYRIHRTLALEESPMLADHVVNHQAVLPMVCAMSWMGNACEQLYPGYRFYRYTNYKVLKGVVFDEALADRYTLDLTEVSKDAATGEIVFDAKISSRTPDDKLRYHYSARLHLIKQLPPAPVYDRMDLTNSADIPGERLYAEKILFHGWSFQGVQRVLNVSPERTTMLCHLPTVPAEYQGQFPVQSFNYFGVDAALQSLGTLARLEYGMGSLPLSAEGGEAYRDIPFNADFYVTLEPRDITDAKILGDLIIHDAAGLAYFKVIGCEIALSKRLIELFNRNTLSQMAGAAS